MADIIDISKHRAEPQFMQCPCTPDGGVVTPCIIFEKGLPLIVSVVCMDCETGYNVINGFVQIED